jgi:hypothetical protein
MEPSLTEELRPLFAGRKVVLTGGPLAGLTGVCRRLRELGAERPFLLATGLGTGEVPDPEEAEWCVVEVRAPDIVAEIRAAMRMLRLLPPDVVDALDRWDPERRALVLSPMFNELPEIAGRRVYGPRRPEWRRLEDKVLVDALWDELGVTRASSEVVAAELMGAPLAAAFLGARCDRARVMPFLEGIPRSIHRVVFPDGVATFRPDTGRGPLLRTVGGRRVRAPGPRPGPGAGRPAGGPAGRGRLRPGRRAVRYRHRAAGAGPGGALNAATRPPPSGARRGTEVPSARGPGACLGQSPAGR